nr:hypothetical protein Iba_chr15eCG7270 [Ipomoea batatas]
MSQLLQIAVASRRSPSQEWRSPETVIAVTVAAASGYNMNHKLFGISLLGALVGSHSFCNFLHGIRAQVLKPESLEKSPFSALKTSFSALQVSISAAENLHFCPEY